MRQKVIVSGVKAQERVEESRGDVEEQRRISAQRHGHEEVISRPNNVTKEP